MRLSALKTQKTNEHEKVQIFIDGSNLYHGLKNDCSNTMLDFTLFAGMLCRGRTLIRSTYYIGTIDATRNKDQAQGQQKFLSKLRYYPYLDVKTRPLTYKKGGAVEKGVDILIATDMLTGALRNCYDTAVLVSGDGDFAPVLDEIKRAGKQVENATFSSCRSDALVNASDLFIELTKEDLKDCFIKTK